MGNEHKIGGIELSKKKTPIEKTLDRITNMTYHIPVFLEENSQETVGALREPNSETALKTSSLETGRQSWSFIELSTFEPIHWRAPDNPHPR